MLCLEYWFMFPFCCFWADKRFVFTLNQACIYWASRIRWISERRSKGKTRIFGRGRGRGRGQWYAHCSISLYKCILIACRKKWKSGNKKRMKMACHNEEFSIFLAIFIFINWLRSNGAKKFEWNENALSSATSFRFSFSFSFSFIDFLGAPMLERLRNWEIEKLSNWETGQLVCWSARELGNWLAGSSSCWLRSHFSSNPVCWLWNQWSANRDAVATFIDLMRLRAACGCCMLHLIAATQWTQPTENRRTERTMSRLVVAVYLKLAKWNWKPFGPHNCVPSLVVLLAIGFW